MVAAMTPPKSAVNPEWYAVVLASLVLVTGCADPPLVDGGVSDGATDGAADGGVLVAPPNIPWLAEGVPPIMLTPCPEGWREVTGGHVTECDPYPEGGSATCEAGEAHFPGEVGCRPIGDPCPAGDYAATLPTEGPVVYVKADAPPGGDGTLDSPHAELGNVGWLTLPPGTTVALAKGAYAGTVPLRAGVSVVGACARDTALTGIDAPVPAVVTVTNAGAPATVRNLSIVGAPQAGVKAEGGRSLTLEGVLLERTTAEGLFVAGAGTVVTATDVVIRATQPQPVLLTRGRGVDVEFGAHFEATRLLVMDNRGMGLFAFGEGTEVNLRDTVIRDTRPQADGGGGRGVVVRHGAHLEGAQLLVTGNHEMGVFAIEPGSAITLSDVIIRDTDPRMADGLFGRGIGAEEGAQIDALRLLVHDNHGTGVFSGQTNTTVTLSDVVIRDTQPSAAGHGRGIGVWGGGRLEGARLVLADNHQVGVLLSDEDTTVTLSDAVIRDTQPQADYQIDGRGVSAQQGAHFVGARLAIVQNHEIGIYAEAATTTIELEDVVIQDILPRVADGVGGNGIHAQSGASVDASRLRVEGASASGVLVVAGAVATMEDLSIVHVTKSMCTQSVCPLFGEGFGIAAAGGALSATRFEVREVTTCGVFLAPNPGSGEPPAVDLRSGIVTESAIGVCLQLEGYDLDRLTGDVEYRDNDTNLDSTELPVPGIADSSVL